MPWSRSPPGGLSPRVRGNQLDPSGARGYKGSIPACAGEPFSDREEARRFVVYPRVCGGTVDPSGEWAVASGLSPRVRGNLRVSHP